MSPASVRFLRRILSLSFCLLCLPFLNPFARANDARDSPFVREHIFEERFLTRAEVLGRDGALKWAIRRREDLLQLHAPSREFIMSPRLDA